MALFTDFFTDSVKLLRGEGAFADTGAVGLNDTHNLVNLVGRHTGTNSYTAGNRMGCRNIRISTIVDIEHGRLRTFKENLAAFLDFVIQQGNRVADIRTQTFCIT